MDPKEYILNNDSKNVELNVKLIANQGGLITPFVSLYKEEKTELDPTDQSSDKNYFFSLGKANELEYCLVNVELVFDLHLIDSALWNQFFTNVTVDYHFSGGKENKTFSLLNTDIKVKSENGQIIKVIKDIMLIY